ncbi:MAG: response regulator [Gemmatimonadota bacterium]
MAEELTAGIAEAERVPRSRPAILVVDDEPAAREFMADVLDRQGFDVTTAGRGDEALELMEDADLVILDAMLPGTDGWEICRQIKARRGPLFPVVMVTARTGSEDVLRTFAAGADDYVAKPFSVAELAARVRTRLRIHRAERELQAANERLADLADQNYELYQRARGDAEERSLLLREIDHRVRNNLSVILGLVSLERNREPARPAAEALRSLETRMRSFLVVYEALRNQTYRGVPIVEVAERLLLRLRTSTNGHAEVDLATGELEPLSERQGFALALVLNELVANALEHGCADADAPRVSVRVEESEGTVRAVVCDGGRGFAGEGGAGDPGSGLSLVEALTRDELDGTMSRSMGPDGHCVRVEFPREAVWRPDDERHTAEDER